MGLRTRLGFFSFVSFLSLLVRPPKVAAALLIGQVLTAGSGYNKAIELRNTAGAAVNLTRYGLLSLPRGQNINATVWSLLKAPIAEEPTFLGGGDSYLIAHPRAAPWLVGNASALSESFLFNGSDVLALAVPATNGSWIPVDIVGNPQQYNKSGYAVAGIPGATRNHTLYRKQSVTSPTTNWALSAGTTADNSQWLVLASNSFIPGATNGSESTPPLCNAASGAGADRRADKSQLRVATWTVDWLFDGKNDPSGSPWNNGDSCPGNMNDSAVAPLNLCNAAGAQARIQRVAEYMKTLDVDILNLVEVESCDVLQQLVDTSNTSYSTYLGVSNDTVTFRNLGLLSKLDPVLLPNRILGTKSYPIPGSSCGFNGSGSTDATANFLTTFQVSSLSTGATFELSANQTSNLTIAFIGLELPGYPLDPESCAIREAQAAIIEEEVQRQTQAGLEVIVAGNFNDWSPNDANVTAQTPISRVLQMLQSPSSPNATPLYSVSTWLSDSAPYTSESPIIAGGSPTLQAVDFVRITPGLASLNVTAQILRDNVVMGPGFDRCCVNSPFAPPFLLKIPHDNQSCDYNEGPKATLNSLSSHWPIVVTFSPSVGSSGANLSNGATISSNLTSSLLASSVVTSASASTISHSKSSSKVLPVVLGVVGAIVCVLLVALLAIFVFVRRRRGLYSHKRLQRRAQVENVEQALQSPEEQNSSDLESLEEAKDVDKPLEEDFRPINRTMPTIKSGEILEVELYVKSLFDDD